MTTLDQYTPEERAGMVGMWATNLAYTGDGEKVGVIACVQHDRVWLIHTDIHGEWSVLSANTVSPRPDLPRAWNSDGTPPKGQWSYANDALGEFGNIPEDEVQEFLNDKDPSFKRRWISEWEPA